jgi:hypothetical protein
MAGMLLLALMTILGPRIALPPHAGLMALALAVLSNTGVAALAINGSRRATVASVTGATLTTRRA